MPNATHLSLNITKLCREACLKEALHILTTYNLPVKYSTYLHLLQANIDKKAISEGKQIYSHNGDVCTFTPQTFLQNTLINMYAKCGNLVDAHKVFNHMTQPDIFSWNMIIAAYKRHGFPQDALKLFQQMQQTVVQPDHFTFSCIISLCASVASLNHGLKVHGKTVRCGFQSHVIVMNTLIDMYAKCGRMQKARELFAKMPNADVVSWNAMITGYAQDGFVEKALEVFKQMQLGIVKSNAATFACVLPACVKMGVLGQGMEIHEDIIERGLLSDVVVVTALIDMYAKCESVEKAQVLFDKMTERNVVSWNAMISGYVENGLVDKAFEFFKQMQLAGVKVNSATFAIMLPACAKMRSLEHGTQIHQNIMKSGFLSEVVLNALLNMYSKCGKIQTAQKLFDKMPQRNVVSWNAMVTGYALNGNLKESLSLFKEMPQRNVVTWNAMITGHAQNGLTEKALEFFKQMHLAGVKPNLATFASVLPACAQMGAFEQGMEIHQKIIESRCLSDVVVNALIDMYAKCGSIHKAHQLFNKRHHPGIISWNTMIAGYAMHGYSKEAVKLFEILEHSGTSPDHISFICVLFACSHGGLVHYGCKFFNCMSDSYGITPTIDHYVCMVDLLGRAGYLMETLNFIIKMPTKPDAVVWKCLLGVCRSYKHLSLGEYVVTLLFELEPKEAAPYVLLSNIYAEAGMWVDTQKVRKLIKNSRIKKVPGCSWIEGHKMLHAFCVGDRLHP
ncbi:pentatricopeptide repeat-containing protein At2g13600 [Cryptomeria japonica]|uniref:pentatricopeptide repeat-containing protein At2g13600 n=1 Tax=Cryptomeria japonica TaxID=3369 RepID=UPI0025AC73F1|nr:pentatricopeptide repeat-containing protein At2g13600 [Cryptomeria japonica]XP_057815491.1 pentatricopeptide repeat-containing protein At2g13600 [Cryptomeria japonica]